MSLSCYCSDDGDWWYIPPNDYSTLATVRSRRCRSCEERIAPGDLCTRHECYRHWEHEIEERIYGDDGVPTADAYLCERCSDLYWSLDDLGYCYTMGDDLRELVREYAKMHARAAIAKEGEQ